MRILFLLYAQQEAFTDSGDNTRSRFPWSDTLIEELKKREDLSLALAVPVDGKSFQQRNESGITLYGLPNPREKSSIKKIFNRITHSTDDLTINRFARQAISEFRPDIIQVFGAENPFGLIAENQDVPLIIHIQGYLMVCAKKWFAGISKWDQLRYSGIKDLLFMTGSYNEFFEFRRKAEREESIIKNCRYFMGRTTFDNRLVSMLSPGSEYFHCEEFIRKIFLEEKWDFPLSSEVTLVSILKGTTYKGIDLLIEMLLILKRFSDFSFRLNICGVSANEEVVGILKKKYRKELKELRIEFKGRLTAEGLAKELCAANFYVHPSYIENSPNSVCEAMALGMPVISTNVGGISSIINDKEDGLLVQEGEPYSLAATVYNLINNYEYAKLLGENARKRSLERHDPNRIVDQLLGIYKTILVENDRN